MEVGAVDVAILLTLGVHIAAMSYWGGQISARVKAIETNLDRMWQEQHKD